MRMVFNRAHTPRVEYLTLVLPSRLKKKLLPPQLPRSASIAVGQALALAVISRFWSMGLASLFSLVFERERGIEKERGSE